MTAQNATCPPDAVLADFGLGKIDAASAETVSQHLETCSDCRQRVANLPGDSFVDRLRAARDAKRDDSAANFPAHPKPTEAWDGHAPRENSGSPNDGAIPPELASHRDYELLKELGRGGMGVVYLARNRMMDRLEVLKVLSKALLDRPGALERFQQEIRSAARLAHPNIVAAYSVLQPGDLLVFAMEYVRGQDLSQVVKARGQLPVANAAFYTHQVALGLQHAHEKDMVHRDIKPNNLMLTVEGKKHVVKILDFGLAKATSEKGAGIEPNNLMLAVDGKKHVVKTLDFGLSRATSENAAEAALTKSGQILGTPDYVAPEQSLAANKADIRADIYSLGCTLYHLLSGGPPFQESSLYGILEAHQKRDPRPLNLVRPDVPVELAAVVTKMMAKVPAKRYQTPAEVARALAPFFKPGQSVATPSPADEAQSHPTAETAAGSGAATPASPIVPPSVALPIPVAPHPLVVAAPTPDFRANAAGKFSAELRLAELAASYAAKGDRRHLPSWWQWTNILLFTRRRNWTPPGRRLMRAAAKHHTLRFSGLLLGAAIVVSMVNRRADVQLAETLAESVFAAPSDAVRYTLDNLRPLRRLALPRLRAKFGDREADAVQRLHAAYALADLAEAPQDFLFDAIANAPPGECRNVVAALVHVKDAALSELARRAESSAENAAKARYAIAALHLGDSEPATRALAIQSDPIHRTTLIHAYPAWHGDLSAAAELLATNPDPAFRSGLCAAIGTIAPETLDAAERNQASKALLALYRDAPDGGTHAAAGWALRQWDAELPAIAPTSRPSNDRRWFVNGQGMAMVEVTAGNFTMGTVGEGIPGEKPAHKVTLTRAFYLADREVTVEQFQRFLDDADYPAAEKPKDWRRDDYLIRKSPTRDCPMNGVTWFETIFYCNWLSTREGKRLCYERTGEIEKVKWGDQDLDLDVWRCHFTADGYRLPTTAEWEYAARAQSREGFCYGGDEDLLPQYAWFLVNGNSRSWPGGLKLPNAFGLFDIHGNVWEWCWTSPVTYAVEAVTDPAGPVDGLSREVRGGAFDVFADGCRCAARYFLPVLVRHHFSGFRVLCGR